MATRSLNKVLLIGNLTRDPELRYTPQGTAVCSFGMATNRSWTTDQGEKREEAEFHNVVAWTRLAEIVAEFLTKGKQVYVEGRLSTREWEGQDGVKRRTTEIIANEVIFLGGAPARTESTLDVPADLGMAETEAKGEEAPQGEGKVEETPQSETAPEETKNEKKPGEGGDIPF